MDHLFAIRYASQLSCPLTEVCDGTSPKGQIVEASDVFWTDDALQVPYVGQCILLQNKRPSWIFFGLA